MERLTPPGVAGVAVFRFAAAAALQPLLSPSTALRVAASGRPVRARLQLDAGLAEDVLVVVRSDGSVEVHAHGAPAIAAAFEARFGAACVPATSPAARLLQAALGAAQLALAVEQLRHDLPGELARLAALPPPARATAVAAALARSRAAIALATPCALHLVGRQNAGKSTAFNRLLGRDRSLAGATPGLTRDSIAEVVVLAGYPYTLHDHAGDGEPVDAIDAAAMARSRSARRDGLRVLLVDAACGPTAIDHELASAASLVVATKSDLPAGAWSVDLPCHLRCSPTTASVAALQQQFGEALRAVRGLPPAGPVGGFAAMDAAQLRRLEELAGAAG